MCDPREVPPDTVHPLARFLGTTAQQWLNLQTTFDLNQGKRNADGGLPRKSARSGCDCEKRDFLLFQPVETEFDPTEGDP